MVSRLKVMSLALLLIVCLRTQGKDGRIGDKEMPSNSWGVVNPGIIVTTSQTISYGAVPSLIQATAGTGVSCSGFFGYSWYSSTDNTNWTYIAGSNSQNYQPPQLFTTTYFQRVVACGFSSMYTRNTAVVIVGAPPFAGSISPQSSTVDDGWPPPPLTVAGTTGVSGNYTYNWQSSPNGVDSWTSIGTGSGYNSLTDRLHATTYYRVAVISNGVPIMYTNNAVVYVNPPVIAGTLSADQTINYGASGDTLRLSGASGGNGVYSYQWLSNAGGPFAAIDGANGLSYKPGPQTATVSYKVAVSSGGAIGLSNAVTITVYPLLLSGTILPGNQTIAYNTAPSRMSVDGTAGGAGANSYTYQWYSDASGSFQPVAVGNTYTPPAQLATTHYYVVTSSNGVHVNSATVTVAIIPPPDLNYIRIRTVKRPGIIDKVTADALTNVTDVEQTTRYFDGLGRSIETISMKASPLGYDLVVPQVYDAYGREAIHYLPYVSSSSDGNNKGNVIGEQTAFNAALFPGEQFYYGQTNYEASPLNRQLAAFGAGASWVGGGRGVSSGYLINDLSDSVQIWTISSSSGSLPVTGALYTAGALYKNTTTDEAGHRTMEYKDKQGKVVLKRVQLWDAPSTGHSGWLNTYYVYDDLDNLRFVMSPKAVEWLLANSWNFGASGGGQVSAELCFQYEYDNRKRLILKKVPGVGAVYMVYDARDRLVLSQDSVLRSQHQWLFTRYDGLNRADSTGLITDPANYNNPSYHQNLAAVSVAYPNLSLYTNSLLTKTFYDDYTWISGASSLLQSTMAGTNSSNFITTYNTAPEYAVPLAPSYNTKGLITGTMATTLETANKYLYAANFYDDHARLIQTQSINYTGGLDTLTTQYDFVGKTLRILMNHTKNGNTFQHHTVLTKMNYDAASRLTSIYKNIDGAAADQLIDSLQYNELGQLNAKYLGNRLDSVVNEYNIRGWLTGINKNYVRGTATHYFGMELAYDKQTSIAPGAGYTQAAFNGNITGLVWKSAGDGVGRKYDFSYDNVNRLLAASYLDNHSGGWDSSAMSYSVYNLGYDANGNILSMSQKGFKIGAPTGLIDQLIYSYQPTSNKLLQVADSHNDETSQLGDFHYKGTKPSFNYSTGQGFDYSYDANGNLTTDNNKSIDKISYNYLNLPELVHMNGKGNIRYTYDATGAKLQKVTTDSLAGMLTTTLYEGGFQYQRRSPLGSADVATDTLQFMGHEEGRARWAFHRYQNGQTGYGWEYDFYEKDHLGNTRVLLTQERDTAHYIATMEAAYRNTEMALFYNIDSTSYPTGSVPGGYPADPNATSPNDSLARVNGNGNKLGPALLLKVMSGDTVQMLVNSFYRSGGTSGSNGNSLQDVLNSLAGGLASIAGPGHGAAASLSGSGSPVYSALNSFLPSQEMDTAGKPKAYLNWMLLDNQFNYVAGGQSGAQRVRDPDVISPLGGAVNVNHSGYLYIWVSNETKGWDVFFDNLSVVHRSGPMLEETHYYPFGLTMAGISDRALKGNYAENKYRYNKGTELQNREFSDGSGLELYATNYRSLDPQLGRFWQIDPFADANEDVSTYSFAGNNPILLNDPFGLMPDSLPPVTVTAHKNPPVNLVPLTFSQPKNQRDGVAIGIRTPRIDNFRIIPAAEANARFKQPAYPANSNVREFKTTTVRRFVRVSNRASGNKAGQWLVEEGSIRTMNAAEIQKNLALPAVPDQVGYVDVPAGTLLRAGPIGPNSFGPGNTQITQYQLMGEIPIASFLEPIPIEYLPEMKWEYPALEPIKTEPIEPIKTEPIEPIKPIP